MYIIEGGEGRERGGGVYLPAKVVILNTHFIKAVYIIEGLGWERERERGRERQTDRQADRQRDRERQRETETVRQTDRQTELRTLLLKD